METLQVTHKVQSLEPYLNISPVTLEGEIWKDIYGYEGIYQVSSLGRVKSLSRTLSNGNLLQERILKQWYGGGHQLMVTICADGSQNKVFVSHLVGGCFIGFPKKNEVYTHLNGNKYNNTVANISIETKSNQVLLSYHNGIMKDWGIKDVGLKTRFVKQYLYIGTSLKDGKVTEYTADQLLLKYGTGVRSIYKCIAKQQNFNTAYKQTWDKKKITSNQPTYENSTH